MGAVLTGLPPGPTGVVVAVLGMAGAVVAAVARHRRRLLAAFGATIGAALLLLVPDGTLLLGIGELLLLNADRIEYAAAHQLWCALGGVLWVCAAVSARRRTIRTDGPADRRWGHRRWGRCLTYLAAAAPLLYGLPRWLWALGFTFGLDAQTTAMVSSSTGRTREVVFGAAVCTGALLTLGLTQRWGERFPGALPLLGGRRVPPMLAIVPAGFVAVVLIGAGFTMWRALATALLGTAPDSAAFNPENWAAWLGNLAWLPWGLALALATIAYRHRRNSDTSNGPHQPSDPRPERTRSQIA